jgi:hypothetical protein
MLKHSWKFTVPLTIIVIFSISIGGYALIQEENFTYRLLVELKDWLKIETEMNKGQVK